MRIQREPPTTSLTSAWSIEMARKITTSWP